MEENSIALIVPKCDTQKVRKCLKSVDCWKGSARPVCRVEGDVALPVTAGLLQLLDNHDSTALDYKDPSYSESVLELQRGITEQVYRINSAAFSPSKKQLRQTPADKLRHEMETLISQLSDVTWSNKS